MALEWADELNCSEPLPALEPFYVLAALELGDPDGSPRWLEHNAGDFHQLYRIYRDASEQQLPRDSAEVLVQFLVWYPREFARSFSGKT